MSNEEKIFTKARKLSNAGKYDLALSNLYKNFIHKESYYRYNDEVCRIWIQQGRYQEVFERYQGILLFSNGLPVYKQSIKYFSDAVEKLGKDKYADTLKTYLGLINGMPETFEQYTKDKREIRKLLQNDEITEIDLQAIIYFYTKYWNTTEAVIYYLFLKKMEGAQDFLDEIYEILTKVQRAENLITLLEKETHKICLICRDEDLEKESEIRAEASILDLMGHIVYIILPPIIYDDIDNREDFDIDSLLEISISNIENIKGIKCIRPIKILKNKEIIIDTTELLIQYIEKEYFHHDAALLLAEQNDTKKLFLNVDLRKKLQIVFQYHANTIVPQNSISFLGHYFYAAKYMYGVNVPNLMKAKPKYKFSIVIPTRGAKETLKYTLQTCLEQSFEDYEIVVSDNTDKDDLSISNIIKEFKSPRIRHIKPPHYLPMHKNFEFAYFCCRGEYIFSLGSDDGLMTYALRILNEIINKFPQESIISWNRLLYMWPSMKRNSSDFFQIPLKYKLPISVEKLDSKELLERIKQNFNHIYSSPQVYINSCMKKEYIYEIVSYTGKFLDGLAPDSYMGPLNLLMNPYIININFPLAIAGMSGNSNGASSFRDVNQTNLQTFNKAEQFYTSYFLQENPQPIGGEIFNTCGLSASYICDLYHILINDDVKSSKILDNINYKELILQTVDTIPDTFETDIWIEKLTQNAKCFGEDFYKEFHERLSKRLQTINSQIPDSGEKKLYKRGLNQDQTLINIDASEFGIRNICDARDFIQKLFNFK